jgi:hypothetical protein
MLLGLSNNAFLAINANVAYLLNATTGAYSQMALPANVACAVPYEGGALVALQGANAATFAFITPQGKLVNLNGKVGGKVMSCSIYNELLAVSYEENGAAKVAIFAVSLKKGTVMKTLELPAVKGADMVLLGPTYTAVYGDSGMYIYKAGKPVQVCGKPVSKAKAYGDMAVLVLKNNAVIVMDVPAAKKEIVITPKSGTVTDAVLLKANGQNSYVLVALKNTKRGLVLYKGTAQIMSIGLQNVCSVTTNANYVAASVKDPNLGNGVAVVPLAWFPVK